FAEQPDWGLRFHLRTGFVELLVVDQHLSRENKSLCAFARRSQPAVDQKFVQSQSQGWLGMVSRGRRAAPAEGCSTKVPALAPVQSAEPSPAEPLTKVLSRFSTELSTVVLKTFGPRFSKQLLKKKSRPQGRLSGKSSTAQLARHFLQQLLVNIEVGMYILHIILVFERFHEP